MKERLKNWSVAGLVAVVGCILFVGTINVLLASKNTHALVQYEAKMTHFVAECVQYGNAPDRCALFFGMGGK